MTRNKKKAAKDSEEETETVEVDLYAEFGIHNESTQEEVKKAYKRLALKFHPDKLSSASEEERQASTKKFQQIASWYQVLSDPTKRKRYDQTGEIGDVQGFFSDKGDVSWEQYFRELWAEITTEQIDEFAKEYKESDKEKADILQSYEKYKGDIWKIMESVPLIELGEIERVYNIIQTAIDADEVALLEKFGPIDQRKLAKKKKRAEKEAQEAEELREEIEARRKRKKTGATQTRKAIAGRKEDNASMDDLKPLIQERGRNRMDAMLQRLADKYTKKRQPTQSAKNKRKHAAKGEESGDNWHGNEPEPTLELSDADFDAFQQKLFSGKKDSNGESSAKNKKGSKRRKV